MDNRGPVFSFFGTYLTEFWGEKGPSEETEGERKKKRDSERGERERDSEGREREMVKERERDSERGHCNWSK